MDGEQFSPPARPGGDGMSKDYPIITLRSDINPWERQEPKETEKMYSRFLVFKDLPPEVDRLRQTLEILTTTGDNITYGTIKEYSSAFRWSARAAAHDRYMAQADRGRMIKRRRKIREDQIKTASALRSKAVEALHRIDLDDLSPQDVVRFIELSWKIERSIFDEVIGEHIEAVGESGKVVAQDISTWSPQQRRQRMEVLREELTRRATRAVDDDEVVA